ncbi:MAG: hypothetical protein Q7T20_13245 [Saprospiraceae bacterium]|nr:hypothetical protein [Saprospiraceae bacterium]
MKTYLFITLFTCIIAIEINAQGDYNWQSTDLAKMGIVRMVTRKTTRPDYPKDSERVLMTRTWNFDGKIKQLYHEVERNEIGQLITWKSYTISTGDPLHILREPNIQTYEYDENGLLIKTISKNITTEYAYFTE